MNTSNRTKESKDANPSGDWFRINRRLIKSDIWLSEPFTRGQAWVDLIGLSNWKDGFVRVRGNRIDLNRGQLAASSVWLSSRWKWSRGKVNRFLNELENDQRIVQRKTSLTTVVTILNYDSYQSNGTADSTAIDTADGRQTEQQTDNRPTHKKKVKKEKKVQKGKDNYCSKEFDKFWRACTRQEGKSNAKTAYRKAMDALCESDDRTPESAASFLLERMTAFAASPKGRAGQFCPQPATWLNQARYDDDPAVWQHGGSNGKSRSGPGQVHNPEGNHGGNIGTF